MEVELARILDSLPATVWTALRDGTSTSSIASGSRFSANRQMKPVRGAAGCRR